MTFPKKLYLFFVKAASKVKNLINSLVYTRFCKVVLLYINKILDNAQKINIREIF